MDLYLTSAEPGLTLSEMIEYDFKSGAFEDCMSHVEEPSKITKMEFDSNPFVDLDSVDISSMASNMDEEDFEFKAFEPLLDSAVFPNSVDQASDNVSSAKAANHQHQRSQSPSLQDNLGTWMNLSSTNNFSLDSVHSMMVNPSAVLPSTVHGATINSSGRTFTAVVPPSMGKITKEIISSVNSTNINPISSSAAIFTLKKDEHLLGSTILSSNSNHHVSLLRPQQILNSNNATDASDLSTVASSPILSNSSPSSTNLNGTRIPLLTIPSSTLSTNTINTTFHQQTNLTPTSTGVSGAITSAAVNRLGASIYRTTSNHQINRPKMIPKYKKDRSPEERAFPKPAYSYSCLIALALKNSLTGSLPVSEIYSFMCEHFPYFRTAPNGWKNSVRHNLSLNKCFEKIEKPVVSGSSQRKGCLWALNPAKAHKMDEEVRKWSKKDLQGIKDAMTNPEILENLERGEMKFEVTSSGGSSCSEDEEEEEIDLVSNESSAQQNSSADLQPIKILNPLNVISGNNPRILHQTVNGGLRTLSHQMKLATHGSSKGRIFNSSESNSSASIKVRRNSSSPSIITSSQDPEYILPDSTMSEINIQSNGALLDDFGNEIKIEGELGVLNPSSSSNLVLRKINSPMRHSPIRSNFIYAASPHHHAGGGINRLVLANTKMS